MTEKLKRTRGSGNVFADVGFAPDEAENLLLQLFVLEKAGYEVCYEAANRPAWIPVPMNGLAKIADELLGDSSSVSEGEQSNG